MYITVSRRGMCFWDDQPCATRGEEDSKVYVERVPGSEHGFQHLTERKDMIVLCFTAAAPSYSSSCRGLHTAFWIFVFVSVFVSVS